MLLLGRIHLLFVRHIRSFEKRKVLFIWQCRSVSMVSRKLQIVNGTEGEKSVMKNFCCSANINFEDHVGAFKNKSTWELVRALVVLKLCAVNKVVDNSLWLMRWTKRLLGHRGLQLLVKPIFYDQFVGGENHKDIVACIRTMARRGMQAMLAVTMEEDVDEVGSDEVYEKNCLRILDGIQISSAADMRSPMIQLKLSGLLPAKVLVTLGDLYSRSDDKCVFVKALSEGYSDNDVQMNPFFSTLNDENKKILRRAIERLKKIGQLAQDRGVKVLVDAENTYLNPGLSLLTLATALVYNQKVPLFWNTYQCYLKDAAYKVEKELELITQELGLHFGAKLVRGAYMDQERRRARTMRIPDPICVDYEATNKNYNTVLSFLLKQVADPGSRCHIIVASHNEDSIKLTIDRMKKLKIDKDKGSVCFGQLYGMSDQVTYPLANNGYSVYKSVPYGSLEEVLPYLARRASENKSVIEGARKEQTLLTMELKRRFYSIIRRRRSTKR